MEDDDVASSNSWNSTSSRGTNSSLGKMRVYGLSGALPFRLGQNGGLSLQVIQKHGTKPVSWDVVTQTVVRKMIVHKELLGSIHVIDADINDDDILKEFTPSNGIRNPISSILERILWTIFNIVKAFSNSFFKAMDKQTLWSRLVSFFTHFPYLFLLALLGLSFGPNGGENKPMSNSFLFRFVSLFGLSRKKHVNSV